MARVTVRVNVTRGQAKLADRRARRQVSRMNTTLNRLKWIFLGLFAAGCAGVWAYHLFWVWPSQRCEAAGRWWDGSTRVCAQPIYIPDITGRQPGETRRAASMREAAEQAARERRAQGVPDEAVPTQPAAQAPAGA